MKYSYAPLVLALGASAVSIKRDSCIFTLTSSGGESGTVGQLSDGQNRVGGGLPTGYYTFSNGQITDSEGRGCILTPPTTQFQCDSSAIPTSGFSISSSGQVEYNVGVLLHTPARSCSMGVERSETRLASLSCWLAPKTYLRSLSFQNKKPMCKLC